MSLNKPHHSFINHPINLRSDAAWVLYQILENGQSSREVMPKVWARHEFPQDRAWLQEMVFGCLRNLPRLQIWLRQLLNKPLKKDQKIIEHLIMVGLYQLAYARTADHAAVSETVAACKEMKEMGLSKLVNAVLRNFTRENIQDLEITEPHAQFGLPKWMYKVLLEQYPDSINDIADNMQKRAALWLRVNTTKVSLADYCDALEQAGYQFEVGIEPLHSSEQGKLAAIKVIKAGEISNLPGYEEGWFAVQDLAAQQAALILQTQPGDTVLDCCAAPGGKTAGILEHQPQLRHLSVVDSQEKRVRRIHENLERLGHTKRFGSALDIIVSDATTLSEQDLPEFDRILLDAPCSATGVIRRHPDIMWLRKRTDIEPLEVLQREILEQAWQKLKVGGTLVYATCSILPQENMQQVTRFVETHSNAKVNPITLADGTTVDYWQIMPGDANMDGFFYARLLKC